MKNNHIRGTFPLAINSEILTNTPAPISIKVFAIHEYVTYAKSSLIGLNLDRPWIQICLSIKQALWNAKQVLLSYPPNCISNEFHKDNMPPKKWMPLKYIRIFTWLNYKLYKKASELNIAHELLRGH